MSEAGEFKFSFSIRLRWAILKTFHSNGLFHVFMRGERLPFGSELVPSRDGFGSLSTLLGRQMHFSSCATGRREKKNLPMPRHKPLPSFGGQSNVSRTVHPARSKSRGVLNARRRRWSIRNLTIARRTRGASANLTRLPTTVGPRVDSALN